MAKELENKAKVKVHIDPGLQRFYHAQPVIEVEGSTVHDCLEKVVLDHFTLKKSPPQLEDLLRNALFFLNEQIIYDLERPVKDGDRIDVLPMPFGG